MNIIKGILWVQQSPNIASTIDEIVFFGAIASTIDAIAPKNTIASIVDAILGDCWTHYIFHQLYLINYLEKKE